MKNFFKGIFRSFKLTIRIKFIIIFTLLLALISVFITAFFPVKLEKQAIKATADKAQSIANMTAFNLSSTLVFEDKRDMREILEGMKQYQDLAYLVVLNNKGEVFSAINLETALKVDYQLLFNNKPITKDKLIYRATARIIHKEKPIGDIFLGLFLKNLRAQIEKSRLTITYVSSIIFILGVAVVFLTSTVITRPLKKMVHTIEEISSGDLSKRATFSSRDEVGNLAQSFNLMVENLEAYSRELKELNNTLESKVVERTEKLQQEVNERKQAQEALKKSEEKYKRLVDNSLVGIYITQDHVVKFCNRKFAEIFGFRDTEEILDRHMKELVTKESLERLNMEDYLRNLSGCKEEVASPSRYELKGIKKDGTSFEIEVFDSPITLQDRPALEGILIDITTRKRAEEERQKLEDQLRQAQKMESLGTLAGGIAHDFNNILSAIMGYTELTLELVSEESKARFNLMQVLGASDRAKELVRHILAFSRKSEKERRPIWLNDVVDDTLKLMRSILPTTIEIRQAIPQMENPVLANSAEIHQIVMNLCTNAGHAMRMKGGVLKIGLKEIEVEPGIIDRIHLESGAYQQLTVSDTGHGMSPDIMERIFDPYFTTKQEGKGTGMGLSVVHGIVKSYGGDITVYSEPGKGTTFQVFLPVSKEKEVAALIDQTGVIPRGNEWVLFVDDENILVGLGEDMLQKLGYHVVTKTNSIKALEAFRAAPDQFDLVISDQTMPNLTGLQLAKEIKKIRADIPIILCSGFSEAINEDNYRSQGISAFLMKPIVKRELALTIRQVLDERGFPDSTGH
ncbi:MAG: response regulator [Candidatus Aminicenantes bacterium]|nr:MAG: response regulator [Candidatus Aminicenantes bacterium]